VPLWANSVVTLLKVEVRCVLSSPRQKKITVIAFSGSNMYATSMTQSNILKAAVSDRLVWLPKPACVIVAVRLTKALKDAHSKETSNLHVRAARFKNSCCSKKSIILTPCTSTQRKLDNEQRKNCRILVPRCWNTDIRLFDFNSKRGLGPDQSHYNQSWAQFCCKMWVDSFQLECTKCWIALFAQAYDSYSKTLQPSCISNVWVTARFDVLFKSPNVTKTLNIFLAHFRFFEKSPNLFNATGHHACTPTLTKIYIDILLPAAKTFGLNLA